MSNMNENKPVIYPATVVKVLNSYEVVINRGSEHQIKEGQKFLIYTLSDDCIVDPETNELLGRLEIVIGKGKVVHVQEKMSTIQSDRTDPSSERRIVRKTKPLFNITPLQEEEIIVPKEIQPFDGVEVGHKAKPI